MAGKRKAVLATALMTAVVLASFTAGGLAASPTKDAVGAKLKMPGEMSAQGFDAQAMTEVGNAMRLHGSNRYETAASISQAYWSYENTIVVALATGENYPDALSLGPSNANLGPTLLVQKNAVPNVTRSELQRLKPCFIVAAGATGVVSDAVLRDAQQYANPSLCSDMPDGNPTP